MTAFDKDDIPLSIQTVEQLISWGLEILFYNYSHLTSYEARDNEVRRVNKTIFFNDNSLEPTEWQHQIIYRVSLGLSADHLLGGQTHQFIMPLGNLDIAAPFKPVQTSPPT